MRKKITVVLIFTFLIITGLLIIKSLNFNSIFDKKQQELAFELSEPIIGYAIDHEEKDIYEPEEFKKMIQWLKDNYSVLEYYEKELKNGYGMKYDEKSGFTIFFLYGEDRKISKRNFSYGNIDPKGLFSESKPSFLEYLRMGSDYDIVLFAYKKPEKLSD